MKAPSQTPKTAPREIPISPTTKITTVEAMAYALGEGLGGEYHPQHPHLHLPPLVAAATGTTVQEQTRKAASVHGIVHTTVLEMKVVLVVLKMAVRKLALRVARRTAATVVQQETRITW